MSKPPSLCAWLLLGGRRYWIDFLPPPSLPGWWEEVKSVITGEPKNWGKENGTWY